MQSSFHKRPFQLLALTEGTVSLGVFLATFPVTGAPVPGIWPGGAGMVGATAIVLTALLAVGLYDWRHAGSLSEAAVRLLAATGFALLGVAAAFYVLGTPDIPAYQVVLWLFLLMPILLALRWAFTRIVDLERLKARVLVLGTGGHAKALADMAAARSQSPFRIVGFVQTENAAVQIPHDMLWRCARADLTAAVRDAAIDEIVVALDDRRGKFPASELIAARFEGVSVTEYQQFCENILGRVDLDALRPSWFLFDAGFRQGRVDRWLKRAFDVCVSVVLMVLFAPLMVGAAIAVKLDSPGPILYRQQRLGRNSQPFMLLKFRSMRTDAEARGTAQWAQANDPRITRVGIIIRKTRIDEIPQLVNVLRGEMSIVGPRPERPEFVDLLAEEIPFYRERHVVRPGITGWAQLNYPYGASVTDAWRKLEYDLFYIKAFSMMFDALILVQTVRVILWNEGAR